MKEKVLVQSSDPEEAQQQGSLRQGTDCDELQHRCCLFGL